MDPQLYLQMNLEATSGALRSLGTSSRSRMATSRVWQGWETCVHGTMVFLWGHSPSHACPYREGFHQPCQQHDVPLIQASSDHISNHSLQMSNWPFRSSGYPSFLGQNLFILTTMDHTMDYALLPSKSSLSVCFIFICR